MIFLLVKYLLLYYFTGRLYIEYLYIDILFYLTTCIGVHVQSWNLNYWINAIFMNEKRLISDETLKVASNELDQYF